MNKDLGKVMEVGAAAPSPQDLARILELPTERETATFQDLMQYLSKSCGTVLPRPTVDGKVAVLFEHGGTFCVTQAFDDVLQALSAAASYVSQR